MVKGIIRDPKIHEEVIRTITNFVYDEGFDLLGLDYSPITGGDGNIEFLLHARWTGDVPQTDINSSRISEVVQLAHQDFSQKKKSNN